MEQQSKFKQVSECPICGNVSFDRFSETNDYFLTQEPFILDKCNNCEFVFTNPIPDLKDLAKYYDSPDYLSHTVKKKSLTGFVYDSLRNINIKKKYALINSLKNGKNILDIGQGTGEFLAYFKKKGWDVLGIEPNESARKFAIENHHIDVFDENKLDTLKANSFDVITLWHVMEHVPDLDKRMMQIKRLLKKDGYVIIAVPNIDSPDAKKYGRYWAGLDVPRHLYHFSESTIKQLFGKYGIELVASHPMKLDAYYVSLLSEKYKQAPLPFIPAFINGLRSNRLAKKDNNYSSMIFVAKQI